MSKQERLERALAKIRQLPDDYFDALMKEMDLSTNRTFPDEPKASVTPSVSKDSVSKDVVSDVSDK